MPLTKECRLFFLDGRLAYSSEYWEEGEYGGASLPIDGFADVARNVRSRFFTMELPSAAPAPHDARCPATFRPGTRSTNRCAASGSRPPTRSA